MILILFVSSCTETELSPKKGYSLDVDEYDRLYEETKERVLASLGEKEPIEYEMKTDEEILEDSFIYRGNPPKSGCIQLYQEDFDQFDSDVFFTMTSSCIEIMEDITFDYTIYVDTPQEEYQEEYYFGCNGNKVSGTGKQEGYGFYLKEYALLKDCVIENKQVGISTHYQSAFPIIGGCVVRNSGKGYLLSQNTQIKNSVSEDNRYGFDLSSNTEAINCTAINTEREGFEAGYENIRLINCSTLNSTFGFVVGGNNIVIEGCVAENGQIFGFEVGGNMEVIKSTSRNNVVGFDAANGAIISNCVAEGEELSGYFLKDDSIVYDSVARECGLGYRLQYSSEAHDSLAENNGAGFKLTHDTIVTNSVAINNDEYGFSIEGGSPHITNSQSENNGIYGLYVAIAEASSANVAGGTFCSNGEYDIYQLYIPGYPPGNVYLEGTIKADNIDITNLFGDYELLPCSYVNKVMNPSFEVNDGTDYFPGEIWDDSTAGNNIADGWNVRAECLDDGDCSYELDDYNPYSDELSAKINVLRTSAYVYQDIPISYEKTYKVSGYIRTECENDAYGAIITECVDENHNQIYGYGNCALNKNPEDFVDFYEETDWTKDEFYVTANNPNARFLRLLCYNTPNGGGMETIGGVWCDSFEVEELPSYCGDGIVSGEERCDSDIGCPTGKWCNVDCTACLKDGPLHDIIMEHPN